MRRVPLILGVGIGCTMPVVGCGASQGDVARVQPLSEAVCAATRERSDAASTRVGSDPDACPPCRSPAGDPAPFRVDCVPPLEPAHGCPSHRWHMFFWQLDQDPETCACEVGSREEIHCYEPRKAMDPLWDVCFEEP